MSGWLAEIGDFSLFENRLQRLKKKFAVSGVPALRVNVSEYQSHIKIIRWGWTGEKSPDIYIKCADDDSLLVLSGVITDLGYFGKTPNTQDKVAERLLYLWDKHGDKIVQQLNGSFSILFYSTKYNQATIFTDRFASRSVWCAEENGSWIIGNFPSAVAVMLKNTPKINPVGLWSLLYSARHLGSNGLFHSINALLAGQKAILSPHNKAVITYWWRRKYQTVNGLSKSVWGRHIANALVNSARRYMNVCKRPYLFLSGGLDSRIAAAAIGHPLRSVTLCTVPNAESRLASLVAHTIGIKNHRIIRTPYWYSDTIDAAALISAGNFFTYHAHFIVPVHTICSAHPEAEFLLGDLLENFNKHYFSIPKGIKANFSPDNIINFLYSSVPFTIKDRSRIGIHFNKIFLDSFREQYRYAMKNYYDMIAGVSEDYADCLDTFLRWADVSITPTYNMLTCIWPLAKERNICFDNDLNDLSLQIPSCIRGAGVLHTWILYHLNKKLSLIPDANTFLPPLCFNKLKDFTKKTRPFLGKVRRGFIRNNGNKPKIKTSGSWLILREMYRKDQKYKDYMDTLIKDESIFPSSIFNLEQIKKTWEEYLAGNINLHYEIMGLLSFGSLQKKILCTEINI
ncbi:MAG: asparagine synthase-related protein [bacterium]